MEWTDITIAIVAIYGAILATYNLIERIKNKFKKIKVNLNIGLLDYVNHISGVQLIFTAYNHTNDVITLYQPEIVLPNKDKIFFPNIGTNVSFPYNLPPGKNCTAWTDLKKVVKTIKEQSYSGTIHVKGKYRDAVDNTYLSNPLKLNLGEWDKHSD